MRLSDCHNIDDFRLLAKQRLPWPVFDYIDGAADDELTKARQSAWPHRRHTKILQPNQSLRRPCYSRRC